MIADAVEGLVSCYFPNNAEAFKVNVNDYKGVIGISSSNNSLMLAFSLRRQREASKSTIREVAERMELIHLMLTRNMKKEDHVSP